MSTSAVQNLKISADFYSRAQEGICAFKLKINMALDKLETDVKTKLEQIDAENTMSLQAVSREASRMKVELQTISANLEELISKKQNCKMFTHMTYTKSNLPQLQDAMEKIDDIDSKVFKFNPNEELLQMLKGADVLGKLIEWNINTLRADHVTDINIRSKRNIEICNISGITVVSREKLVVIDSGNKTVKLIDSANNKIISELQLERLPWTVTAITKTKVVVTQPGAQRFLFLTCDDKLVVDTAVSIQRECYGIAYYRNSLIVTFWYPDGLKILSMTGEVLQCFDKNDQGRHLFIDPRYVSVDMEDPAMFVSDWYSERLTKLSLDGKVMAKYKDSELSNPGQCAIDKACLVYLCGEDSDNVHLLTSECKKLKTVLTLKDGAKRPCSISFCETTGRLFVGMGNKDNIKVYLTHD